MVPCGTLFFINIFALSEWACLLIKVKSICKDFRLFFFLYYSCNGVVLQTKHHLLISLNYTSDCMFIYKSLYSNLLFCVILASLYHLTSCKLLSLMVTSVALVKIPFFVVLHHLIFQTCMQQ